MARAATGAEFHRLDDEGLTHLRQVITRLARQLNKSATAEDLTPSQASVLGLIAGRGPIGLPELARLEGLNPTMLSRVVGKLEAAGLIVRVADPADLRSAFVSPTKLGRSVHARIKTARVRTVGMAVSGLTAEEERLIVDALPALDALVGHLRAETG